MVAYISSVRNQEEKQPDEEALRKSSKTEESQFLKFTWVAVVLPATILGGAGLFYMTCKQRTKEPLRACDRFDSTIRQPLLTLRRGTLHNGSGVKPPTEFSLRPD